MIHNETSVLCSLIESKLTLVPESSQRMLLPNTFRPGNYHVICTNSGDPCFNKKSFQGNNQNIAVGNRRLRIITNLFVNKYVTSATKMERHNIINNIVNVIREAGGEFVQHDLSNDTWWEVSDNVARYVYIFHVCLASLFSLF